MSLFRHAFCMHRMRADLTGRVVNQFDETYDIRDLCVCDVGAFSTGTGASPMSRIMALADYAAQHLMQKY